MQAASTTIVNGHVIDLDSLGYPVEVDRVQGVRCGMHGDLKIYHANVEAVRLCAMIIRDQETQMAAEQAAEAGYERWLEDRGWSDALQDSYRENGLI